MPRRRREKELVCPKCGSRDVEVVRTWQLVSPFPDKYGRITVTVMGMVECRSCGYRWRATISKLKIGEKGVEVEGRGGKKKVLGGEEKPRRVKEIVLDLEDLEEE